MQGNPRLIILVAEDSEDDIFLLERAFKKVGIGMPVHICRDGAEAMAYLKGEREFADRVRYPFPRVLITDLKMPKCSGFELLGWLHDHPECNLIPKIVLSSSAQPEDVTLAYQLGANAYFCKPGSSEKLISIVEISQKFWTEAVLPQLPQNC
jgi:CheY-like chemotaxis protein